MSAENKEPQTIQTKEDEGTGGAPPRVFAVVRVNGQPTSPVQILSAPTQTELKKQLTDPTVEILAVFRGRQLALEAKRVISFI